MNLAQSALQCAALNVLGGELDEVLQDARCDARVGGVLSPSFQCFQVAPDTRQLPSQGVQPGLQIAGRAKADLGPGFNDLGLLWFDPQGCRPWYVVDPGRFALDHDALKTAHQPDRRVPRLSGIELDPGRGCQVARAKAMNATRKTPSPWTTLGAVSASSNSR